MYEDKNLNTLTDYLQKVAQNDTKGVTFIQSSTEEYFLSYKDLYRDALSVRSLLEINGLSKGDKLIIYLEDNVGFIKAFWGCILGGIIPVPLSVGNSESHRTKVFNIWNNLRNAHLLCDNRNKCRLKKTTKDLFDDNLVKRYISADQLLYLKPVPSHPLDSSEPDDIAYIQYSSGSTGSPRGVTLTHKNLVANTVDIAQRSALTDSDRTLSWMPLTHDMGLICFHLTGVLMGIDQFIMPTSLFIRRPLLWLEKAANKQVTHLYSPNFGYEYFLSSFDISKNYDWDLSTIKLIYNGAEPISYELCIRFIDLLQSYGLQQNSMYPGYGLAEASVAVTLPSPNTSLKTYSIRRESLQRGDTVEILPLEKAHEGVKFIEVGAPVSQCQVFICDEEGLPMKENMIGEICIQGTNVTNGYYNNKHSTKNLFDRNGLLKTGDLGFVNNGNLVVTGRIKNLIIINGQNYYPQDIERCLYSLPGLGIGKVVACGCKKKYQTTDELVIFVLFRQSTDRFIPLVEQTKQRVFNEMGIVATVVPVRSIPKTTSGKIQNFLLKHSYETNEFDNVLDAINKKIKSHTPAQTAEQIADLLFSQWRLLTGFEIANKEANIFQTGVSSITLVRWVNVINKVLSTTCTVGDVFRHSSIRGLSDFLLADKELSQELIINLPQKEYYRLSFGQKRLWSICKLAETNSVLNLVSISVIESEVNFQALQHAFQILIDRHEILRSVFIEIEGEPKQKIFEQHTFELDFDSIEGEENWENRILEKAHAEASIEFDFAKEILIKARLTKINEGKYVLVLVIHHLISDGWSFGIMSNEIKDAYNSYLNGTSACFNHDSPMQYKEFAAWQNKIADSVSVDKSRRYWQDIFHDEFTRLSLPTFQPRPIIQGFNGKQLCFKLDDNITRWAYQFSKEKNVTPFNLIFTLLNVLFYRFTGQSDIVIGTDVSGRVNLALENQIGYFLNTLPIRSRLKGASSFEEQLHIVTESIIGAIEHQLYPFDKIVEDVQPVKDPSRTPLFDILVIYQNFNHEFYFNSLVEGAATYPLHVKSDFCLVDLEFEFYDNGNTIDLNIRYNTDLFQETQIIRLWSYLCTLIAQVQMRPNLPVASLPLISSDEVQHILAFSKPYDTTSRNNVNIVSRFEQNVKDKASCYAISCNDASLTYSEFNKRINQLADYLVNYHNIKKGDRVAIVLDHSSLLIEAIFALLKLGVTYIPIDIDLPIKRQIYMIDDSRSMCVITSYTLGFEYDQIQHVNIEQVEENRADLSDKNPQILIDPKDIAYILYTSGSTGHPKGVIIEHDALAGYVDTFTSYFNVSANDKVIQLSPISFDVSVEEIFPILCQGGELVIIGKQGRDIDKLINVITSKKVTIVSTTPMMLLELNSKADKLRSLRKLISGGDQLQPQDVDQLIHVTQVYNTYGPTESTVCATYHPVKELNDVWSIGKPPPGRQVYILDDQLQVVPIGVTGEICISGEGLARGYVNRPEETAASFVPHPFSTSERLYKTGDLGRWSKEGTIEFAGRKDDQVKIRGYRIETKEIEKVLANHEAVKDTLVVVHTNGQGVKELVAYIIPSKKVYIHLIREYLSGLLPFYMVPVHLIILEAFPLTLNGKVNRKALPRPEFTNSDDSRKPDTDLEVTIARIWETHLNQHSCNADDNFFNLGGDSLKAARILSYIQKETQIKLSLRDLFKAPTIAELAKIIEEKSSSKNIIIEPSRSRGPYPMSYSQQALWLSHKMKPENIAYNITLAQLIKGDLDVHALEKAIASIFERHESLRTNFKEVNNQPCQIIKQADNVNHVLQILSSKSNIQEIVLSASKETFDLEEEPLARFLLYKISDNQFLLVIVIHHIITDGWSIENLQCEINTLYNTYTKSTGDTIKELPIQFKDYSVWQRESLASKADADLLYWKDQLNYSAPAFDFPADLSRPTIKTYNGNEICFALDNQYHVLLSKLRIDNNSTWTSLLVSLTKCIVYKYTTNQATMVGVPFSGRTVPQLEEQMGFFVNTLPVCTHIDPNDSLCSLLHKVQAKILELDGHQGYPFDLVLKNLDVTSSSSSFYSISFSFLDRDQPYQSTTKMNGIVTKSIYAHNGSSKFDLHFRFEMNEGEILGAIEYNTDIYITRTIKRLIENFKCFIKNVVSQPNVPISEISYISDKQLKLLHSWGISELPTVPEHDNLIDMFKSQVNKQPDAIAMKEGTKNVTFGELDERSDKLANLLNEI